MKPEGGQIVLSCQHRRGLEHKVCQCCQLIPLIEQNKKTPLQHVSPGLSVN